MIEFGEAAFSDPDSACHSAARSWSRFQPNSPTALRIAARKDVMLYPGRRQEHERNRKLLLVRVEAWRDESPDLKHDERSSEQGAGDQGDVHVERKRFGRPCVYELAPGGNA